MDNGFKFIGGQTLLRLDASRVVPDVELDFKTSDAVLKKDCLVGTSVFIIF